MISFVQVWIVSSDLVTLVPVIVGVVANYVEYNGFSFFLPFTISENVFLIGCVDKLKEGTMFGYLTV